MTKYKQKMANETWMRCSRPYMSCAVALFRGQPACIDRTYATIKGKNRLKNFDTEIKISWRF
ncbi:MAG TPA: hypothetical protein DEP41_09710 [Rhodobacter sp.]|nr:hypothetical protein [Rhodobacter sp.]